MDKYINIENGNLVGSEMYLPFSNGLTLFGENAYASELKAFNYYLVEDNVPTIDSATQRIAGSSYDVLADKVVKTYTVVDIPMEEIYAAKAKTAEALVQAHINTTVVARGYDNENSIAKYLVEGNPFYDECKAISLWIGSVWVYSHQVQADVMAGTRVMPTIEELIAELPELVI